MTKKNKPRKYVHHKWAEERKSHLKKTENSYSVSPAKKDRREFSSIVVLILVLSIALIIVTLILISKDKNANENITWEQACGYDFSNKFSIQKEYVCYNDVDNLFVFSVKRGDVYMDKLSVKIETEKEFITYYLTEKLKDFINQKKAMIPYDFFTLVSKEGRVALPRMSSEIYVIKDMDDRVLSLEIAPIIYGHECNVVDSQKVIPKCPWIVKN